jgi:hypothetical protein
MRRHVLAVLFAALLGPASHALAEGGSQDRPERWSTEAALRIAPLEGYPVVGLSLDGLYRLGRWRIGGGLTTYAPRDLGDATRFALSLELVTQLAVVEARRARFLIGVNVGVALFRDDFVSQSYFQDELALAPGLGLTTSLEIDATETVSVVVDIRGLWFFARDVTDHEWLELGVGVRLRLP